MTEQVVIEKAVNTIPTNSFERKIGKTLYRVNISFNENSNENMQDKIERLIKSEILKSQE